MKLFDSKIFSCTFIFIGTFSCLSCFALTDQNAEISNNIDNPIYSPKQVSKKIKKANRNKSEKISREHKKTLEKRRNPKLGITQPPKLDQKICNILIRKIVNPLKKLATYLPDPTYVSKSEFAKIVILTNTDCDKHKSKSTINLISQITNKHTEKIGVILPLKEDQRKISLSILTGLKAAENNIYNSSNNFTKYIIKDSTGSKHAILKSLAELILIDQVAIIIGGLNHSEGRALIPITNNFMIPTLVLNSSTELITNSNYAFQVFPLLELEAKKIITSLAQKNVKKVSIFRPSNGKSDTLINALEDNIQKTNIQITHNISYESGDFDSMERAVKIISGIDYVKRRNEYDEAFQKAKQEALDANQPFNAKTVILDPQMLADAVIIPDHFKNVRHFVNIFKYHRVNNFMLAGTHEWRSKALIEPWDDFLQGSFFVDFIGNYLQLPKEIVYKELKSPYFAPANKVGELDFALIGYQVGDIALRSLAYKTERRKDYIRVLTNLKSQNNFYTNEYVFNKHRSSNWPTYKFEINHGSLFLLKSSKTTIGLNLSAPSPRQTEIKKETTINKNDNNQTIKKSLPNKRALRWN
ncbi:MAG: hypothetical protein R3B45_11290 [Bdellovibrionota bacterium]